jgi:hypothetical protein
MNRWNIPEALEREIIERDRCCVYCGIGFGPSDGLSAAKPTWEHIVNDSKIVNRANIARCCVSCNASKGTKDLADWLESDYCNRHGISQNTLAEVVKRALVCPPTIDKLSV